MSLSDNEPRANILVAYPYWSSDVDKLVAAYPDKLRILLDSGAFTAWKQGAPINLDDYCRFIESLPVAPWRYFTLDVIGDAEGSMRNYETMLKRGFKPVPIFTRGEQASVLDDYYKTSDVVGVGGLVGTQNNKGFVNGIMRHVGKRRVHWLGFTNIDYLKHYRPYMCDSSSWESGGRYASIRLYMGKGRYVSVKKADFLGKPSQEILDRIKDLGFDPYALRKESAWRGGNSTNRRLSAASALALSLDVQKNLGTLMFNAIAAATIEVLQFFTDSFDRINTRGKR